MTPLERIHPPAPETSEMQDFHAKVRWYYDERVLDLAFGLMQAQKVVEQLVNLIDPAAISETLARDLKFFNARDFADAKAMMGVEDVVAEIEEFGQSLKTSLAVSHCGDCTAHPATCIRCWAEETYRLPSTVTWKNKGEGWGLVHEAIAERDAKKTAISE